ncbi:MAG: hypothetical protein APF78_02015 [Sphingomonadales bacterium BRH_c3]|nr:MAG: hypothetical protein APF78_02015 [Sphingomonadales bacterium BRH_c3]
MRKFVAIAAGMGTALGLAACSPPAEEAAEAPAEAAVEAAPAPEEDLQAMDGVQDDGMANEAPVEEDERGNPVDQRN